jgi:CheY-like chemotaxis protein
MLEGGFPYGLIPRAVRRSADMSGSVLIVDDDPGFRRLAYRMLTEAGLTVVAEAEDARSAVIAAKSAKPCGILVDLGLPDRRGLDLARELLALDWHPRVVLTSGDTDTADLDGQPDGLPFVAKDDLPDAPLRALLSVPEL